VIETKLRQKEVEARKQTDDKENDKRIAHREQETGDKVAPRGARGGIIAGTRCPESARRIAAKQIYAKGSNDHTAHELQQQLLFFR